MRSHAYAERLIHGKRGELATAATPDRERYRQAALGCYSWLEVDRARKVLADRIAWLRSRWIGTELMTTSKRRRARHEQQQALEQARRDDELAELERVAALPDLDLAWLLSMGWTPEAPR